MAKKKKKENKKKGSKKTAAKASGRAGSGGVGASRRKGRATERSATQGDARKKAVSSRFPPSGKGANPRP